MVARAVRFWLTAVLFLSGCISSKTEEARVPFPNSSAQVVAESEAYGGGPGSSYKTVFVRRADQNEQILSARSLYPVRVAMRNGGQAVELTVCGGRIFRHATSSDLPYGPKVAVAISVQQARC